MIKTSFTAFLTFAGANAAEIVENGFKCDTSVNFMQHGPRYN